MQQAVQERELQKPPFPIPSQQHGCVHKGRPRTTAAEAQETTNEAILINALLPVRVGCPYLHMVPCQSHVKSQILPTLPLLANPLVNCLPYHAQSP
jgi:hypothetical protein